MDFDLEKILSLTDPKSRPYGVLFSEDPESGEPMLLVPKNKKEEKVLKKSLSPTGKEEPQAANPKSVMTGQKAVSERMLLEDNYGLDKNKIKEFLQKEESGISQLEQTAQDMRKASPGVNWKPYAAFLDAGIKGQNLAGAVPNYETPEEKQAKIAAIENLIQQRRSGLTENALGLLRNTIAKQQLADQRHERFQEAQGLKKEDTLRKDLIQNVIGPVEESNQMFSTMDENLARGDYQSVMNTLSNFSRAVAGEKGVLTDQDIKRVLPKTFSGTVAEWFAYAGSTDAKFDPEIIAGMRRLIETAKQKTMAKQLQQLEARKQSYQNPRSKYFDIAAPGSGGVGDTLISESEKRIKQIAGPAKEQKPAQVIPTFEDFKKLKQGAK